MSRMYTDAQVAEMAALYKKGYSLAQVGYLMRIPSSSVRHNLLRMECQLRRHGRMFDIP